MSKPGISSISPIWAYAAAAGLVMSALAGIMLAPYLTPPSPGHITGILFRAGTATPAAIGDIIAAEDDVQIVDIRLGGRLVFVVYHQPGFPRQISRLGAMRVFDAVAAGCHGLGASSPLVHLPS